MNTEPTNSVLESNAETKARLECEKLEAEINAMAKPFFQTSTFYTAITPVALAVVGLIFTWSSGWFDVQATRIANEKTLVEAQTENLKMEKSTLEAKAEIQEAAFLETSNELLALKLS